MIAVALETPESTAVLDDAAARTCARSLNVRLMGTLAIVVRAKLDGVLIAAGPVIRAVLDAGLYLDETLIRATLRFVGEEWTR